MYDYDIDNVLHCLFQKTKKTRVQYNVLCANELEKYSIHTYPVCIVVNNKECNHAGQHWVCFFKKSIYSPLEFFCSYGESVNSYGKYFINFKERNSPYGFLQSRFFAVWFFTSIKSDFSVWFVCDILPI